MDGGWHGLLFDNPTLRVPAALSWNFQVPVGGAGPAMMDLDWLPLTVPRWQAMTGCSAVCTSFAEPAEASIRQHRFDRLDVRVEEQRDDLIRVVATISGDLDGLGRDPVGGGGWLRFTGFTVQLSDATTASEALARLGGFTDIAGLVPVPDPRGIAWRFVPDNHALAGG